ncbi:ABC transporter permease [Aerophototrophica crusticola]|uniref:ABC transporter permease n=1 Tax=Aerophototrophica crusticola TaxID=1709002 RepID=A0A858R7C6_9PROT|nr:ABC transporter permease [Rhodospirillaceae bacterium B3]
MARFLVNRLLQSLVVLLVVSFVVYMLIGLMPGDPIDLMIAANPELTPEDAARLRALYGLDQPLLDRYWNWLTALLQGDLGYSRLFAQPVGEILLPRLLNTLALLAPVLVISLAIAIPVGIYAARHPYTKLDSLINLMCFGGISMPPFWLALLLIMLFAVTLGWLPAGGMGTIGGAGGVWDSLKYMVLPVTTLVLLSIGHQTRYVRAAMLEALRQDYVRTARAKGVPEGGVVYRHALRNALIPVVTIVALEFGTLFGGALVTETMFSYLGMGKLIYDSILGNDFNVALCALLFVTIMVLLGNLLADMAYVLLDPRVSFQARAG